MRARGFWIAAGMLLAAVSLWLLARDGDAAPRARTPGGQEAPPDAVAIAPVTADAPGMERAKVETDHGAPATRGAAPAVFRGRAVDGDARPLAGVRVVVGGWQASDERLQEYERDHGQVVWNAPDHVTTGADGRFEIAFVPPPPYQFTLDLMAEGRVSAGGRWGRIEPGSVEDFGDIALLPGARVRGRMVDEHGRAVRPIEGRTARVSITRYNRADRPRGEIVPWQSASAQVAPDGSFEFRAVVTPARWDLEVQGLLQQDPRQGVDVVAPETDLEVVVFRPESVFRLEGVVVDELGRPVANAMVSPVGDARIGRWISSTMRDGRFEAVQPPGAVDPKVSFELQVERPGYRTTQSDSVVWGDRDVRIVMRRNQAMEVLVVRADDGSPVEEYGLRVLSTVGFSSSDRRIVDGWSHEGGITHVTTLSDGGPKRVHVEPVEGSGLAPASKLVDVDLDAPSHVTVELPLAVSQRVRLVRSDGSPVEASRVELIDAGGQVILADTSVTDFDSLTMSSNEVGVVIAKGTTGVDGRCRVIGPSGAPVTIRCVGAHPTLVVHDVTLDDREIELEVAAGTDLTIRLDPPDVPAAWRRTGERIAAMHGYASTLLLPSVFLRRSTDAGSESFPLDARSGSGVTLDENGVAVLRGVPAGSWTVHCGWWDITETGAPGHRSMIAPDRVVAEPGMQRELVVDVSAYRTGSFAGTVHFDGRPGGDVSMILHREVEGFTPSGRQRYEQYSAIPDAGGVFRRDLPVGTYEVYVRFTVGTPGTAQWVNVRALPDVTVEAGVETEAALRAAVARTTFRFVGPNGGPVPRLALWSDVDPWLDPPAIPATDEDGRTTIVGTPGSYALSCRIRSVMDDEDYRKAWERARERHGSGVEAVMERAVVTLEPVTIAPGGEDRVVEIRLPAAWDR